MLVSRSHALHGNAVLRAAASLLAGAAALQLGILSLWLGTKNAHDGWLEQLKIPSDAQYGAWRQRLQGTSEAQYG